MNVLNEKFEKIYCITLYQDEERQNFCKEQFNLYGIEFEFLPSIEPNHLLSEASQPDKSLVISHLNCIKLAKLNSHKNIVIFEDDFIFYENWELGVRNFLDELPSDWRFLYLGESKWAKHLWPTQQEKISEFVYRCAYGCGSHCMAINADYYDFFIDGLEKWNKPIDIFYQEEIFYKYPNVYTPEKRLCDARSIPHEKYFDRIPEFDSGDYIPSLIRPFSLSP
jgi:GR25 family glycosyltransferase involved in LPS biosynthesis